jgi:hypothetical protein
MGCGGCTCAVACQAAELHLRRAAGGVASSRAGKGHLCGEPSGTGERDETQNHLPRLQRGYGVDPFAGEIRGMSQHDTRYAAGDAKPSRFMHTLTDTGTVRAFMCSDCGLIRLYGDPDAA